MPRMLRNPFADGRASAWRRRLVSAALALAGCGIAAYLALYQYRVLDQVWEPFFGNGSRHVLQSDILRPISRALGFPVHDAALGGAAYLTEAVLALAAGPARNKTHPWRLLAYAALVLAMGLGSVALILIQGLVLHTWCTLCLASAGVSLAVVALSGDDLRAALGLIAHRRGDEIRWPASHGQ